MFIKIKCLIEFKIQVRIISTKIRDTVPEKYDVLRSVVFAIDTACPEQRLHANVVTNVAPCGLLDVVFLAL